MLKFMLQLAVLLAGFFVFMFLMGLLMPVFTNPIVFTVIVVFIVLGVISHAVRS
jgi:hypothetical protein